MNKLKIIDISGHQKGIDLSKIKFDGAIVKATEGDGFVDNQCDIHYQQLKKLNKLKGVYHFARNDLGNTAKAEAKHFINSIQGYLKDDDCLLVLDWESAKKYDVTWAKQWLDEVFRVTGKKPLIYMSESVANSYNWQQVVTADYGLWIAKYRDNVPDYNWEGNKGTPPRAKYWSFYAIWQWTSSGRLDGYNGNLDLNEFYGNRKTWLAYAKNFNKQITKPIVSKKEEVDYRKELELMTARFNQANKLYQDAVATVNFKSEQLEKLSKQNKKIVAENLELDKKIAELETKLEDQNFKFTQWNEDLNIENSKLKAELEELRKPDNDKIKNLFNAMFNIFKKGK